MSAAATRIRTAPPTTATGVLSVLEARFAQPAWAFFREVRNSTGFRRAITSADALAMGLWPGRGLEVIGFEVKVSRSDWVRELKNPEKADSIQRFCDRWYVAVPLGDIVRAGELPETWGLMVCGKEARTEKEAPKLEAVPLDRLFVASLLRSAHKTLESARRRGFDEGYMKAKREAAEFDPAAASAAKAEADELKRRIERFECSSGLKVNEYAGRDIGEVARIVKELGWQSWSPPKSSSTRLDELLHFLSTMGEAVEKQMVLEARLAALHSSDEATR